MGIFLSGPKLAWEEGETKAHVGNNIKPKQKNNRKQANVRA